MKVRSMIIATFPPPTFLSSKRSTVDACGDPAIVWNRAFYSKSLIVCFHHFDFGMVENTLAGHIGPLFWRGLLSQEDAEQISFSTAVSRSDFRVYSDGSRNVYIDSRHNKMISLVGFLPTRSCCSCFPEIKEITVKTSFNISRSFDGIWIKIVEWICVDKNNSGAF